MEKGLDENFQRARTGQFCLNCPCLRRSQFHWWRRLKLLWVYATASLSKCKILRALDFMSKFASHVPKTWSERNRYNKGLSLLIDKETVGPALIKHYFTTWPGLDYRCLDQTHIQLEVASRKNLKHLRGCCCRPSLIKRERSMHGEIVQKLHPKSPALHHLKGKTVWRKK